MIDDSYTTLLNRIRQRCRQQHWYGGDKNNTAHFSEEGHRYQRLIAPGGNEIVIDRDPNDHPLKTNFAYPSAAEEQLLTEEETLGFPIPPLLRTLYSEIANGGFGPGYGLIGVTGGFCEAGSIADGYGFHVKRSQLIQLEDYESDVKPGISLALSDTVWPRYLLYLCDWGFATTSCIDARSGYVFDIYPGERNGYYIIQLHTYSLKNWLELWLEDRLQDTEEHLTPQEKGTLGDIHVRKVFEG